MRRGTGIIGVLGVVGALSLACGGESMGVGAGDGGSGSGSGAGGPVPLVVAATQGETCVVTVLSDNKTLATFDGPCTDDWFLAESPTQKGSFLVWMDGFAPQLGGASLPEVPLDPPAKTVLEKDAVVGVDFIGFDAQGKVVALREMMADVDIDERRQKAWVFFNGKRRETDFEDAQMFGISFCDAYSYEAGEEQGAWSLHSKVVKRQLYEGMNPPWCAGAEGGPELERVAHPSGPTFPMTEDEWTVPPALASIQLGDLGNWNKLVDQPVAISGYWFEGLRTTTPIAVEAGGTWTVLKEFEKAEQSVSVRFADGKMLACSDTTSALYDLNAGSTALWTGGAPCPAMWPLVTGSEGP